MLGETIENRYQIEDKIGAGGMGIVYRAVDTQSKQVVAIKHLKSDLTDTSQIKRFQREGEILRQLNHPNMVKLLDTVTENGQHYLVMEYVAGGDLKTLLQEGTLTIEQILKIVIEIADALTRAHYLDIIHRDLKPANILLEEHSHTVRLTDFGVAQVINQERLTQSEAIIGTVDYLPPEAFTNEPIDNRADIWAFGILLFEMLTGEIPFQADSIVAKIMAISTQPTPDLESLRPDAPIGLVDLVYRMLEKSPSTRIVSMRHIGATLEDIVQGRSLNTPSATRFATPTTEILDRPKHNLPAETTPFVGRTAELSELANFLNDEQIRLITIVGSGGMGKTRLSLEAARRQIGKFNNGIYLVELAPLTDISSVISAIANATNYQFQADGRSHKRQILDFLANQHLLLIMDNFEHLLAECTLVAEILNSAPAVRILTTSRQRLNLSGETLVNLHGMSLSGQETSDEQSHSASLELFVHGAKRVQPQFELNEETLPVVTRICQVVDGIPLGIVLAASWLGMLSVQEIAEEIQQSIDFLASDMADIPERQRNMRAVFDYSWDLLSESERKSYMYLSVFRGGFLREAAEQITKANLRTLMNLINKSLIQRDIVSGRYTIHELLRQYAAEKLTEHGLATNIQDAHIDYFTEFVHERELDIKGRRQLAGLDAFEADFENVRVAWKNALSHGRYEVLNQMLEGLKLYFEMRNLYQERHDFFVTTHSQLPNDSELAYTLKYRMLVRHAGFMAHQDDFRDDFAHGLDYARQQNNQAEIAYCLFALADMNASLREIGSAINLYHESLAMYRELEDKFYITQILNRLAAIHLFTGQLDTAAELAEESIICGRQCGDQIDTGWALHSLASYFMMSGNTMQGAQYFEEARQIWLVAGNQEGLATALFNIASEWLRQGEIDMGRAYAEESRRLTENINNKMRMACADSVLGIVAIWEGNYEESLAISHVALLQLERMPPMKIVAYVNLIMANIGLKNYGEAKKYVCKAISYIRQVIPTFQTAPIVLSAFIYAHDSQFSDSAELLGLCYDSLKFFYIISWSKFGELMQDLSTHLGEAEYRFAYERGKSLDLDDVAQKLLDEFSQA